jgi:hypothetical protein
VAVSYSLRMIGFRMLVEHSIGSKETMPWKYVDVVVQESTASSSSIMFLNTLNRIEKRNLATTVSFDVHNGFFILVIVFFDFFSRKFMYNGVQRFLLHL